MRPPVPAEYRECRRALQVKLPKTLTSFKKPLPLPLDLNLFPLDVIRSAEGLLLDNCDGPLSRNFIGCCSLILAILQADVDGALGLPGQQARQGKFHACWVDGGEVRGSEGGPEDSPHLQPGSVHDEGPACTGT